jgi:hypothetical protein
MNLSSLEIAFEREIFPGFPFRNRDWRAVAFERDNYDNSRIPEWFFRSASMCFNDDGKNTLSIKGDCFALDGHVSEIVEVPFEWEDYRDFMLSPQAFSIEYKMVSKDGACACWTDAELTVFGGEAEKMTRVLDTNGGADSILEKIEQEFFLGASSGYEEMRTFFRGLLYPEQR